MKKKTLLLFLILTLLAPVLGACSSFTTESDSDKDEMAKKICFLPLDTRPCCMDIPMELAELSDAQVLAPPMEQLTYFKDDANTDFAKSWLKKNATSCDALVISMEQLVYGGLIQSRNGSKDDTSRQDSLELLRTIKEQNPDIPIYLSNVLMRTYTSVFKDEDLVWWEKINAFSSAYYKAEILKDLTAAKELESLKEEIPSNVLDTFLNVRAVNHALNLACVDLVKEGVVDKLVICQEDCSEGGIQSVEQTEIMEKIQSLNLGDKVSVANGTDEAGAELIMYAVKPEGVSTSVLWLGENVDFTANYEDRRFKDNLTEHCRFMNISMNEASDNVLCILPPKNGQGDYATGDFTKHEAYPESELNDMCMKIKNLIDSGKHCYILDLDCANGGTPQFLSTLGSMVNITDLYGYSGWNTASNSLGTILSQLVATDGKNSDRNKAYTAERILDECVYQSTVRPSMYQKAETMVEGTTGEKVNIFELKNIEEKETWLNEEFSAQKELISSIFKERMPDYKVSLRWPRLFEISVKCIGFIK